MQILSRSTLNTLTLRIILPVIVFAAFFAIILPFVILLLLSGSFDSSLPMDIEYQEYRHIVQTIHYLYLGAALLTIIGIPLFIRYLYGIEQGIHHTYALFEEQIEDQVRHLILLNDFFTREVAEHQRDQLEFQLINRIFEHSLEGIILTDGQARILKINPGFTAITGYSAEESLGKNPRILKSGIHNASFYENMWSSLKENGHWENEIWNRRKDGEAYPQWLSISTIRNESDEITHYIAVFYDITDLKHSQRQIVYQANHDALTGLPNRQLFRDHLELALAQAQRHNCNVGVMFLDVDKFKNVNDSLGYTFGDLLLQDIAKRLKQCCRHVDTVARPGGDEFMIILPELKRNEQDAIEIAQRILESFATPFVIRYQEILSSVSIGMTIYPTDGTDVATLEKNADIAMNKAKEQGRKTYLLYTKLMQESVLERLHLERDLRNALKNEEFRVYYQPQVEIKSGRIVGMEALVRWQRSEHELVPPDKFIPLAEEIGLIVPLGEWVLQMACQQTKVWHEAGFHSLTISINLSARQFQDTQLIQLVQDVLTATGLAPEFLRLEITESTVMKDVDNAIQVMMGLREIGVRLSIDDFGTGYSSLNYLRCFPLDEIKMDKSFVKDIPSRQDDVAIAKAIFSLAHSLNMKVLAEGVETRVQLEFMRNNACDGIQGFLFSEPVAPEAFTQLLKEGKHLQI